jgi:predicted nucleotidyltransferase
VFRKLLKKVAAALEKSRIPYMIIGGQAVLLYGEPRLTKDIDIALGVGIERLSEIRTIVDRLRLDYLTDNVDDFTKRTMVLPVSDRKSGIRVDLIFSFSLYERQAIERAREVSLGRTKVKFACLEDVVIHKMIAGRPRDIEDVESILSKNPRYDSDYIEKWLGEFDAALEMKYRQSFMELKKKLNPE